MNLPSAIEGRGYAGGYDFHLVGVGYGASFREAHIGFGVDGYEVYVGVRDFEADDGHAYAFAGDSFFEGFGHFLGEYVQVGEFLVAEVEDVAFFSFRHHKRVAFSDWVDVQKSIVLIVFRYFIGWDFSRYYATEYGWHGENWLECDFNNFKFFDT